jgi:hypothetical protein
VFVDHDARRALRAQLLDQVWDGPHWSPLLADLIPPSIPAPLSVPGAVVEVALAEWGAHIKEPRRRSKTHRILEYYRAGLGWHWMDSYANHESAWCGAFLAWAWRDYLKTGVRKYACASTYRLRKWAKGTDREVDGLIMPGDIVIVGARKAWGDHITTATSTEQSDTIETVEGNAWGRFPTNRRGEGVIVRERTRDEIRFIYRPIPEDLQ